LSRCRIIAVLDTETTGLCAPYDRLVEIAVMLLEVERDSGRLVRVLDSYQALNDPGRPIPWQATRVHGITDAMVRGQRIDPVRVAQLLADADLVVAHNSGFDKGFVRQLLPEADRLPWACSCRGIPWRKLYPQLTSSGLQRLAEALGVPGGTAHRALGDVQTTVALILQEDPAGRTHLAHLLARLDKTEQRTFAAGSAERL
jgi:DNA polymerase-3 subunit epsilon